MAVDMFLKLEGIPGESQDSKHKGEIDVLSFSWGLTQTGTLGRGGAGAGKTDIQDVSIVKRLDSTSPTLMKAACQGQHIGSGILTLRKAGDKPVEYMKIVFSDLLISSYQTGGSSGAGEPGEQVSFSFQSLELTGSEQRPDGSIGDTNTASCSLGKH